jgi:peptide deformylase
LNKYFRKTYYPNEGTSHKKEAKINLLRNFVKILMNNRKNFRMIYPIVAYGDPVLRKVTVDIDKSVDVKKLSEDMFETMYNAKGVGLAAPQVGLNLRIFVVDGRPFNEGEDMEERDKDPSLIDFKQVFINADILDEKGKEWAFEEGCLSIPDIREDIYRPTFVTINFFDENWVEHTKTYEGLAARIIQHEYDHIDGILFTDHLNPVKKRMLKNKLAKITKGIVDVDYKMKFPK